MGKAYQNKLTVFFSSIQAGLKSGKLTEKEFNILLGMFLQKEINDFVHETIDEMLPESKDVQNLTMVSYKKSIKFTYAKS